MNFVLKRILIAASLVIICIVIVMATKSYGVWVITAIAIALFLTGVLFKEECSDKAAQDGNTITREPDESEPLRRDDPGSL